MSPARPLGSDYMAFAKLESAARFNLASSGIANAAMEDLGPLPDLKLCGDNSYGWAPLLEAIASRFAGVRPEHVVTGVGTAFANHLALAALIAPGDEVLIETPTYELLESTLRYLGASLTTFARRADQAWRLDPAALAAAITPRTRLVVLTNLHNPSSQLADLATVAAIAEAAAKVGAHVLVDEVYLELMAVDGIVPTSFTPGGNVVVTSSLTKAYGLTGLRCGWILAPAELALRMWRLNDLFGSTPNHPGEQLDVIAIGRLEPLRARAGALLEENRAAYRAILGGHPALEQTIFDHGTTVFPRLLAGDGDAFFNRLKADFETSVVPGRFFGCPDHMRIGLGADPAMTRAGLEQVARALGPG